MSVQPAIANGVKGLEFRVLGPLEVVKGGEVIEIPAAKLRSVLAAFVLNSGRLVPFEGLVEAVWCGSPPRAARVTLHRFEAMVRAARADREAGQVRDAAKSSGAR